MKDQEKLKVVAKLISTPKGRNIIIQLAKDTNSMDKLGKAIIKSLENFTK